MKRTSSLPLERKMQYRRLGIINATAHNHAVRSTTVMLSWIRLNVGGDIRSPGLHSMVLAIAKPQPNPVEGPE